MKYSMLLLVCLLMGVTACIADERFVAKAHCIQEDPINGRIAVAEMLDTTGDGDEEEVVIYTVNGDIFLEIFQATNTQDCNPIDKIELGTLNLLDRQMQLEVTDLELLDMTGDNLPELHVGYEQSGGGTICFGCNTPFLSMECTSLGAHFYYTRLFTL